MGVDSKSKKNMWQLIAQEYYGEIPVDKKINRLRMIWRKDSSMFMKR
jgi:hypothetical protein